ncbi:hypothetical protein [Pontibacter sp. G13]|uniref:hypothetical protein n=1 Tax=Pontibacter sp. G13 TaxID=3074898 RepID=UPI00288C521D|nr:hypothetical protein [Pontibacter sp. G13]WNJ21253.1 hypothetical protein RJD25_12360 [Pontibacter sp. G13]
MNMIFRNNREEYLILKVLAFWLLSILAFGWILQLNSCSSAEQTAQVTSSARADVMGFDQFVAATFQEDALNIQLKGSIESKPVSLRVYDDAGYLIYLQKDPNFQGDEPLAIDLSYAEKGNLRLLVQLDNGDTLDGWVERF